MRRAYARQIEIVPATFVSTLCESPLPFPKTTTATRRPHLNEAHPEAVRKSPEEAMSLDLSVDGLGACPSSRIFLDEEQTSGFKRRMSTTFRPWDVDQVWLMSTSNQDLVPSGPM